MSTLEIRNISKTYKKGAHTMEKTLELIFTKSDGAKKTLSIADPREGLTLAEAKTAADKIIAANVLTSGGLELTEFTEARIKTVTIDVLA